MVSAKRRDDPTLLQCLPTKFVSRCGSEMGTGALPHISKRLGISYIDSLTFCAFAQRNSAIAISEVSGEFSL